MSPDKIFTTRQITRRSALLHAGALAAAPFALPRAARAEAYPSKPIRVVIAFPPAGATDILGRSLGDTLRPMLGQSMVIDNKPGAGGVIGLEAAANAPADGYTVFLCALTNQAIASHLFTKTNVDIAKNFEPISLLATGPHMLNVNPQVPAKNMTELIAWLKANDGKINYESQGNGTLSHLEAELFAQKIGVKMNHIPYKGSSQAIPDLISGTTSIMFDSVAASMEMVKSGKLRALGLASTRRLPILPDLPTILEAGVPGYEVENWYGFFTPKGTPPEIVSQLDRAFGNALKDPALVASLTQKGYTLAHGGPAKLAAVAVDERNKWGAVIKAANVTL
jgi:tripartite-type tricarboxylate transporter receptor subunit TctC